ncbi:protein COFACTOR ASSEMBLY OF COMPLEX C SUBUNIT B CCB2, chloroplastic [Punica granatum]|uniref:Protein COFACTOR ASSEMBLY OF COMPLEX C SUBUNIT B CCB2, chloroplastic n=1 Tax=Punica granatum TaxID=22663 RepID=A0A6P8CHX8_PUNGR|nr:protein COFACTOR ASSEMBLY OF COMPLEX C SUBUNIT B CCB2, chloroplastic [Punica granatum]
MSLTSLSFSFSSSPIPVKAPTKIRFQYKRSGRTVSVSALMDDSQSNGQQPGQLNLSVLRFTLGIPGFDESYLPRYIGYGFGSLLLLNHFVGSDLSAITPAQLRTEALGLSLAAFSAVLPYLGKFLPGTAIVNQASLPAGNEQLFIMSEGMPEALREQLAWSTYVLLRNTNTIAALVSVGGELCVRGYWSTPDDISRADLVDWFNKQIQNIGLPDLKDALYFPVNSGNEFQTLLPKGTRSLLILPLLRVSNSSTGKLKLSKGLVLLASSMTYAYSDKDRAWIEAIANQFRG